MSVDDVADVEDDRGGSYTATFSIGSYSYTVSEDVCLTFANITIIIAVYSTVFTYSMLGANWGIPALLAGLVFVVPVTVTIIADDAHQSKLLIPWYVLPAAGAFATAFYSWRVGVALLLADYVMYIRGYSEPEFGEVETDA
jgi:hypothetical protein